jgi:transcriptional regulator with XRE-family HTH domain
LYYEYNARGGDAMGKFGEFFRALRAKNRLSLREFCLANGFDPGNISRLERGALPPPESTEKLEVYAKALRLKKGSDDWYTFFDLAAAERGRIPEDVLSDKKLAGQLPVLFRTLRGQRVDDKALDDLIERIRRA